MEDLIKSMQIQATVFSSVFYGFSLESSWFTRVKFFANQINENGLYELRNSAQLIDIIAFNYQSNESNISTYQINELERIIKNKKTASIKIIDEEITQLKQKIKKIDKKEFWRILIILALIFFFLEVTLIKLLKI